MKIGQKVRVTIYADKRPVSFEGKIIQLGTTGARVWDPDNSWDHPHTAEWFAFNSKMVRVTPC